jgi:NodT family efflux transporter outer membrane factor (OMF) lipoprotein
VFRGLAGVLLLAASGCTVGPDFHAPKSAWNPISWFGGHPPITPAADTASTAIPEMPDPAWWDSFHDPQLTTLEQRLPTANFDVRTANVRLAQSRSQLGITRAGQYFVVNGNSSYTRERESPHGVIGLLSGASGSGTQSPGAQNNGLAGTQGGIPNTSLTAPFDLYQVGFDASWELDLWGRVRRSIESAQAQVDQSNWARRDTLVTAQAELARDYLQLRGTQQLVDITEQNLASQRHSLALTQERAQAGLTTDLDVANQAAQVQSTQSQLPNLRAQEQTTINAIALLLGEPPDSLDAELGAHAPVPPAPSIVPVGLPGDILRRRPDIREAEDNLHAATAAIGVAVADFFPTVTLSGSVALQATQFKYLGDIGSNTYGLGPSLTLPIFQGGKLTRTLELRRGQEQEAGLNYQQTVLNALHDVSNTLTNYDAQQGQEAALARAVVQQQRALELAQDQYTAGLADFLNVLDAQRQLLAVQQQEVQARTDVDTDLVQIFKALGGGWQQAFPEQPEPKPALIPAAVIEP